MKWRIGNVTVTRVVENDYSEGGMEEFLTNVTIEKVKALEWLMPHFATPEGRLRYSIHALVIDTGKRKIIVDTCVGNGRDREPFSVWHMLQTNFLANLETAGFSREGVDTVLCTHLHLDHIGWNTMRESARWVPTFPNARYLFERHEYECLQRAAGQGGFMPIGRNIDEIILADSVRPIVDAGLAEFVEPTHRLCDEVSLIPTHGHTPGHVSVVIESCGEKGLITGDFIHHPYQLVHLETCTVGDFNPTAATETRRRLFAEIADTPILVIGTHWSAPTAGKIVKDGNAFRLIV